MMIIPIYLCIEYETPGKRSKLKQWFIQDDYEGYHTFQDLMLSTDTIRNVALRKVPRNASIRQVRMVFKTKKMIERTGNSPPFFAVHIGDSVTTSGAYQVMKKFTPRTPGFIHNGFHLSSRMEDVLCYGKNWIWSVVRGDYDILPQIRE